MLRWTGQAVGGKEEGYLVYINKGMAKYIAGKGLPLSITRAGTVSASSFSAFLHGYPVGMHVFLEITICI